MLCSRSHCGVDVPLYCPEYGETQALVDYELAKLPHGCGLEAQPRLGSCVALSLRDLNSEMERVVVATNKALRVTSGSQAVEVELEYVLPFGDLSHLPRFIWSSYS